MPFDGTDLNGFGGGPQNRKGSWGRFFLKEMGLQILAFGAAEEVSDFCCNAIDNFPLVAPLGQPSNNSMLGMTAGVVTFVLLMIVYVLLRADYLAANDFHMI